MSRRYSFESNEELYHAPSSHQQQYFPEQGHSPEPQPRYQSPPASPGAHPDSSYHRLQATRRFSRERNDSKPLQNYGEPVSPIAGAPIPPPHRDSEGRSWGRELGYSMSGASATTPGADNFGEQASGGLVGVARSVADANARESGLEAMRNTPGYDPRREMLPYEDSPYADTARGPSSPSYNDPYVRPLARHEASSSSITPLGAAILPAMATPHSHSTGSPSLHSFNNDPFTDNPYNRYSRALDPGLGAGFDPNSIADDGDDGLEYRSQHRPSMLSLGHNSDRGLAPGAAAAGAGGAVAAGGIMGTLGGLVGRNVSGNGTSPQYNPVQNQYGGPNDFDLGQPEKSEWLSKQSNGNKKLRWFVGILVALLIVGGIAGGVAGGVLSHKNSSNTSSSNSTQGQSASADTADNGDLNKNSAEIKKLLNNPDLHKVFPGIDYTPMYTQYPGCLTYPASQNNVTRDLAVLSQLTNTIRLYGTDCNQTELLLHSIDQLGLNGTIKIWLGVWQDNNATTNARQLAQMYDIFDKYGTASFVGVIIGNEVLFREDMTATELGAVITGVKSNFTSKGIDLPVACSDLGDNWSAAPDIVSEIDYLMSNIHPFFAGVTAEEAASWTYDFWTQHDTILKTDITKNIIAETGWPSTGGTDCGATTTCTNGSVAGIQEMNTFMDGWVCDALTNGTNYFWFEAFDEPWKILYDTPGEEWEDKWGLMDVNRNLKDGVVIPSCGGKTVS